MATITICSDLGDRKIKSATVSTVSPIYYYVCEVKLLSCVRLCNPMDCSLPGFSVHGIFQARVLEWVAISFSRGSSGPRDSNPGLLHCRQTLYPLSHKKAHESLNKTLNCYTYFSTFKNGTFYKDSEPFKFSTLC